MSFPALFVSLLVLCGPSPASALTLKAFKDSLFAYPGIRSQADGGDFLQDPEGAGDAKHKGQSDRHLPIGSQISRRENRIEQYLQSDRVGQTQHGRDHSVEHETEGVR